MIAVTAATGKTGRAIVQAAAAAGFPVRAVIHSDDGRATVTEDGAAEAVVADLLVPAEVRAALAGTEAVVHIGPAMHPREIAMGETVIDVAAAAGIDHFVLMSVTHPQLEPLLNHESKLAAERRLLLSRLRYTILQPMHYMQDVDVVASVSSGGMLRLFGHYDRYGITGNPNVLSWLLGCAPTSFTDYVKSALEA